jgi:hypothetical protein
MSLDGGGSAILSQQAKKSRAKYNKCRREQKNEEKNTTLQQEKMYRSLSESNVVSVQSRYARPLVRKEYASANCVQRAISPCLPAYLYTLFILPGNCLLFRHQLLPNRCRTGPGGGGTLKVVVAQ